MGIDKRKQKPQSRGRGEDFEISERGAHGWTDFAIMIQGRHWIPLQCTANTRNRQNIGNTFAV